MCMRRWTLVLSIFAMAVSVRADPTWVSEVVDANAMNGAQALSASALNFNGMPAVVYRKRTGTERPRLVIASRGAGGWSVQDIASPLGSEQFYESDAITVNGQTYAAVAY